MTKKAVNMDRDEGSENSGAAANAVVTSRVESRRRLIRAGLVSAPVLMTLVSRPVHAVDCKSASATVSANASGKAMTCAGDGPATWLAAATWPVTKATALLSTYLPSAPVPTGLPPNPTLLQVLQSTSGLATDVLARNVVAALLNVLSGKNPSQVVTQSMLNTIIGAGGNFNPSPGVPWNTAQTNAWLLTLFVTA